MVQHPYNPQSLQLPGYVPNLLSRTYILTVDGFATLTIVSVSWFLSGRARHLTSVERLLICSWIVSGLTHILVEGYFLFNPDFYKKTTPVFLAEVWKEYSKGDSRYAARDSAIVGLEGITVLLLGPACFLAVYAIATRKPYQYVLQLAVCLGELYGVILYFITAWLDGNKYAAGPFYFWCDYVFINSMWVVIPSLIALRCWRKITRAFENKNKKKN